MQSEFPIEIKKKTKLRDGYNDLEMLIRNR